jgi:hypothetical protein
MPARLACPDVRALNDYLLGQMPEARARGLEEHVAACSACALKLNDMVNRDTLARLVPSQAVQGLEVGSEVEALIRRLRDVVTAGRVGGYHRTQERYAKHYGYRFAFLIDKGHFAVRGALKRDRLWRRAGWAGIIRPIQRPSPPTQRQ